MSNRIARIEDSAFTACNGLTGDIKLPKTLTYIGLDAFSNCWTLSSVEMQSVPQMGSNAFFNVDCSKTVVLSDDSYVYTGSNSNFPTVSSVTAPCSLDLTGSAVENHPNLTHSGGSKIEEKDAAHLVSSNCITDTYHYSCNLCHKNLPATYTAAGTGAHNYTEESDAEVYLATAASCGTDATYFYKCANCTEHNSETWTKAGTGTGHHTFAASDLTHDVCTVCKHGFLRYAAESQQDPYIAENLKDEGGNTLEIKSNTFDGNNYQGVMEFNAPLVEIGDQAFLARVINGITIPNTVTTIGTAAFSDTNLTSINIPNSVKTIGCEAFYHCGYLSNVTLGKSIESIGGNAFEEINSDCNITLKSLPQITQHEYHNIFYYLFQESDGDGWFLDPERKIIPANIELDDNSFVAPGSRLIYTCIANHVTYTRTGIKNQWGTIVVPFMVNGSGDDYDLYTLSSVSNDELTLTKVTGRLAAGTPALIRINSELVGDGKTYDLTLRAVTAEVDAGGTLTSTPAGDLTLTGSYEVTDITYRDGYIISNNAFWSIQDVKGDNDVYCAPFRAYLKASAPAYAKALSIGISEEVDAIEAITAITEGNVEFYDMNGRKQNNLQTGVNIVKYSNGKTQKVIIK